MEPADLPNHIFSEGLTSLGIRGSIVLFYDVDPLSIAELVVIACLGRVDLAILASRFRPRRAISDRIYITRRFF